MKRINFIIRLKRLQLVILMMTLLISVELVFLYFDKPPATRGSNFDPVSLLESIKAENDDVYEGLRVRREELMGDFGIARTNILVNEAFRSKLITLYECHALSHIIGHFAKLSGESLTTLAGHDLNYCGGGYKHGLESQIVEEGGDFKSKLYSFCSLILKYTKTSECYHGGGHEFMRQTMDPGGALSLCDTLIKYPKIEFFDCYKGVFSEYTNLIGGVDGHTGLKFSGGPPLKLSLSPLEYCTTFEEKYQEACALEVNGYGISPASDDFNIEAALLRCTANKFQIKLKAACLHSVSAVASQHELPKKDTIFPPNHILSLPMELRRAYITGVTYEMKQFIEVGLQKDWQQFCSYFDNDDSRFCQESLLGQLQKIS